MRKMTLLIAGIVACTMLGASVYAAENSQNGNGNGSMSHSQSGNGNGNANMSHSQNGNGNRDYNRSQRQSRRINSVRELDANRNGIYEPGEVDCNAEYQSGPCVCYCPVTKFKPQYYCEDRCVQEPYTVRKKCCRYVNKWYCKKVPEYYYECETRYRTRTVKDKKCCYQPYTCVEKRCCECPPSGGCN